MRVCVRTSFTYFLGWWKWRCPLHISNGKGSHAPALTQLICLQRQESETDKSQVSRLQRFINQLHTRSTEVDCLDSEVGGSDRDPGEN